MESKSPTTYTLTSMSSGRRIKVEFDHEELKEPNTVLEVFKLIALKLWIPINHLSVVIEDKFYYAEDTIKFEKTDIEDVINEVNGKKNINYAIRPTTSSNNTLAHLEETIPDKIKCVEKLFPFT